MKYGRNGFDFGDFIITKREILASISIIAIMFLVGILISGKISECQMDYNEKYNKAVKIENSEMFQYGMDTNVGNAFVYGNLEAVDTVTYPEINGEYIYVEKVTERYTMHTRQVAHTRTINGKTETYYTTEVYWTWDAINREDKMCQEISFCDVKFPSNKIGLPGDKYIDTIMESSDIRYVYYGIETHFTGTIFTELRDKTITDNSKFYENLTIDKTIEYLETDIGTALFWVFWIIFIGIVVFAFYYHDNNWLE